MRKIVAFCPWVESRVAPFDMCGVRITGFKDAANALSEEGRDALWRARTPYCDHFLNRGRTPRHWNENPLLYAVDPTNPLKEPTDDDARLVWLTNAYLYTCVFATNRLHRGGGHDYTNSTDWALYFQPVQDPVFFSIGERRLYGTLHGGGHRWSHSAFTLPVECNQFGLYDQRLDRTLIDGVTALNVKARAALYLYAVRTFMGGTSDHHLWQREHDLPFIWGALEQILESDGLATCAAAQAELQKMDDRTWLATYSLGVPRSRGDWRCASAGVCVERCLPSGQGRWSKCYHRCSATGDSVLGLRKGAG